MLAHTQFVIPPAGRGLSDLSFDGSGWFGTGLFGDNWGIAEIIAVGIGIYALYAMFFTTRAGVRGAGAVAGRRRSRRAARYREKAKRIEAKSGFGGLVF